MHSICLTCEIVDRFVSVLLAVNAIKLKRKRKTGYALVEELAEEGQGSEDENAQVELSQEFAFGRWKTGGVPVNGKDTRPSANEHQPDSPTISLDSRGQSREERKRTSQRLRSGLGQRGVGEGS